MTVPLLPETELRQLVLDTLEGRVFTDRHGPGAIDAFFPLKFMDPEGQNVEEWGIIYEYVDKALARSVNGVPRFMSFRILHIDQVKLFNQLYREVKEQRDQFVGAGKAAEEHAP